jgi:hypothetical protein
MCISEGGGGKEVRNEDNDKLPLVRLGVTYWGGGWGEKWKKK